MGKAEVGRGEVGTKNEEGRQTGVDSFVLSFVRIVNCFQLCDCRCHIPQKRQNDTP
jgi:hypothetical protein